MSANTLHISQSATALQQAKPSFIGLVGGELFKASRRWSTWLLLVVLVVGGIFLGQLAMLTNSGLKEAITKTPLNFLYDELQTSLGIIRVFVGFYSLIITAYIFGLEYQQGTIRVIISRGVGKVQLLCAKITGALIISLLALLFALVLNLLLVGILTLVIAGNLDAFKAATNQYWSSVGIYIVTLLVNNLVTILLATALCSIGRSLATGLGLSLLFFPADNIGTSILRLVHAMTKNDFWVQVSKYLLGPALNNMPTVFLPKEPEIYPAGVAPLEPVSQSHIIWVVATYAIVCLVISLVLTWKRDVKE